MTLTLLYSYSAVSVSVSAMQQLQHISMFITETVRGSHGSCLGHENNYVKWVMSIRFFLLVPLHAVSVNVSESQNRVTLNSTGMCFFFFFFFFLLFFQMWVYFSNLFFCSCRFWCMLVTFKKKNYIAGHFSQMIWRLSVLRLSINLTMTLTSSCALFGGCRAIFLMDVLQTPKCFITCWAFPLSTCTITKLVLSIPTAHCS